MRINPEILDDFGERTLSPLYEMGRNISTVVLYSSIGFHKYLNNLLCELIYF